MKLVRIKKLLFIVNWAATAGKTKSSLATGAMSLTQFAAFVQFVSAPPPSQVLIAEKAFDERERINKESINRIFFIAIFDLIFADFLAM